MWERVQPAAPLLTRWAAGTGRPAQTSHLGAVRGGRAAPCRHPAQTCQSHTLQAPSTQHTPASHTPAALHRTAATSPAAAGSTPGSQLGKPRHGVAAASQDYAALCQGHHPDLPPSTPQLHRRTVSPDFLRDYLCGSPRCHIFKATESGSLTYVHHTFFGLLRSLCHSLLGLFCSSHHAFFSDGEPFLKDIHPSGCPGYQLGAASGSSGRVLQSASLPSLDLAFPARLCVCSGSSAGGGWCDKPRSLL